jgi:hypothetical protein
MIDAELLHSSLDLLKKWAPTRATSLYWVNWREGFQIKMKWYGIESLACYLDFGKNSGAREAVMKRTFDIYAAPGEKPSIIDGHGWTRPDYSLHSGEFISVNTVADLAQEMGYTFTVLYVQECIDGREVFTKMGIPLNPGESGKEWIDGKFVPYSKPSGKNL